MDYKCVEQFKKLSDQELIERFNDDVGHSGWVSARANFLSAMRQELLKRFDCSEIIKNNAMSMNYRIKIENKKLIQLKF